MSGTKKAKMGHTGAIGKARKHHCPTHDVEVKGVMGMPGRRMKYNCPEGCELSKGQPVLK